MKETPVSEDSFAILTFLSGPGFWLLLVVVLVGVLLYRRFRK